MKKETKIILIGIELLTVFGLTGCSPYLAEPYSERNQQNYHYIYDSNRARYRAIEDCEYYKKGSNKDEFCEDIVRSRVYPVQGYESNPYRR